MNAWKSSGPRSIVGVLFAAVLLALLAISFGSLGSNAAHVMAADNVADTATDAHVDASASQVITVTGMNSATLDIPALETAVMNAAAGDTILLDGVFDMTGCSTGITITKNITITGMSDPNADVPNASQLHGCGPALIVNMPTASDGALTIQNLYFKEQQTLSVQFMNSMNPVNILDNRFTGNIPVSLDGVNARFAVGIAEVGPLNITNTVIIENNHVDWSDYPNNDTFYGDDNGFAFAATDANIVVRNNFIKTVGEAIEIEGNKGQNNTYLVEGNVIETNAPLSPAGESDGPPGSVAEGLMGGHPALIKLHANEGTYIVRYNKATLTGQPMGVCIMATTLNDKAQAGDYVNMVQHNECTMDGQLTAVLGAWGQSQPFFTEASLSGTIVSGNVISGTGGVGIGMISRTSAPLLGAVVNNGHSNFFLNNDFSNFTASRADIGFDPETYGTVVVGASDVDIVDLGSNIVQDEFILVPRVDNN